LIRSIINKITNFIDAKPHPKQRLPKVIQFPINDICNSKCQMCNIWQNKKGKELSVSEIEKILLNFLFKEVTDIGINGGEPTLRKDLPEIVDVVIKNLPKLKGISLITNGIREKSISKSVNKIVEICDKNDIIWDVMVSIDGIGKVHDNVRGRSGNFESAENLLHYLKQNKKVNSIRIGCTIIKENVYDLENVLDWCERNEYYARFRLGIPHKRLYSDKVTEPFELNQEEKFHVAAFLDHLYYNYEKDIVRKQFYRSLRDQLVYNSDRKSGCTWKNKGVTLFPNGDLGYCAVESDSLGNCLESDSNNLYWDNKAHLNDIVENRCKNCYHDYEGLDNRRLIYEKIFNKVKQYLKIPALKPFLFLFNQIKILLETKEYYKIKFSK